MVSTILPSSIQSHAAPIVNWIQQNPRIAAVTAVAFAVLGITACATLIPLIASASLTAILGLAAATLSLSASAMIAYLVLRQTFFKTQGKVEQTQGSPPNIPLSDIAGQKNYRVQVMNDTLAHLKAKFYTSPDGTPQMLNLIPAARGAAAFLSAGNVAQRPGTEQTRVAVKDQDCLYAAAELHTKGLNPIVLDMANGDHFGGGYLGGGPAPKRKIAAADLAYALPLTGNTVFSLVIL
jgi:hypothetical protein